MNVNAAEDATGMIVIDENIVRNNSCFRILRYWKRKKDIPALGK